MLVHDVYNRVYTMLPKSAAIRANLHAVKQVLDFIRGNWHWSFWESEGNITLTPQYITGTVTIAQGATAITGTGTTWTAAMTGRKIRIGTNEDYTFTYLSGTTGTISPAYAGTTVTAATYTIYQDTYSLASDCDSVIDVVDLTNKRVLEKMGSLAGKRLGARLSQTYTYQDAVYAFGRDSSNNAQITFLGPPMQIALIRYWYYRRPTAPIGPSSNLDFPSSMDETFIQGVFAQVLRQNKQPNADQEQAVFERLLMQRRKEDSPLDAVRIRLTRQDMMDRDYYPVTYNTLVEAT